MINETVILLSPLENCSQHRLARHIEDYLRATTSFDRYLYQPLQEIFSKVIAYDYIKRMTEVGVKGINEEVIELVRREHPRYVLWLQSYYEFRESTFATMRKEGSIVIGWSGDDEVRFDDYSKWWIPYLDYCVTGDINAVPKYRELGARLIHAVPCTGIAIDRDWSNIEEKHDVSFVGVRDTHREQYINELKNRNISVHVFGSGWGNFVPFEEMIDIFKTSKINLSFAMDRHNKALQIKGKIFEVCLAGGFLLTEYNPVYESYYEIDKEIVCFRNAEEMIDKTIYYLNHDEERRAIAQAGWKRATAGYSSFHMVSRIFNEIEKDIAAKGKRDTPYPQEPKIPRHIRKRLSNYYLSWGNAFSQENYKGLWRDAFALSISYNPFNIRAWGYYIIGFFPSLVRSASIKLYRFLSFKRIQNGR